MSDLIGGAERVVVDAAVGLQNLGHKVVMYTSHHDPTHCFEETRDGNIIISVCKEEQIDKIKDTLPYLCDPLYLFHFPALGTLTVRVGGNTIIPRTIMGRFYIVCAILRNLHLALTILMMSIKSNRESNRSSPPSNKDSSKSEDEEEDGQFDVIIVDQLSVSIPLLRWTGAKIFFYCHFPDKLLTKRESFLKKFYRVPVDFIEELTTGKATNDLKMRIRHWMERCYKHKETHHRRFANDRYGGYDRGQQQIHGQHL